MTSLGLFPLIAKPTGVTAPSVTMKNFTNISVGLEERGILMMHFRGDLTVFPVYKHHNHKNTQDFREKSVRDRSPKVLEALKR